MMKEDEYFPPKNHWWHVPLYVSSRGLTILPIPYRATISPLSLIL